MKRILMFGTMMAAVGLAILPSTAYAQADEIQVYDGGLAPKGVFNLTWHNNFIAKGIKTTPFPGGVTADRSFNGVPEWAYGVTDWFEAGLYMPLYTRDKNLGFALDGFKLRTLFALPNGADRKVALAANFEFSYNAKRWDTTRITSEIRPIIAFHVNPKFDFIVNPIVDTAYDGAGNLEFVPAVRIAYMPRPNWAMSLETYSDFGHLNNLAPAKEQSQQLFGVLDHTTKNGFEMEFGIGVGLNDASDRLTFKMILAKDLNKPKIK